MVGIPEGHVDGVYDEGTNYRNVQSSDSFRGEGTHKKKYNIESFVSCRNMLLGSAETRLCHTFQSASASNIPSHRRVTAQNITHP